MLVPIPKAEGSLVFVLSRMAVCSHEFYLTGSHYFFSPLRPEGVIAEVSHRHGDIDFFCASSHSVHRYLSSIGFRLKGSVRAQLPPFDEDVRLKPLYEDPSVDMVLSYRNLIDVQLLKPGWVEKKLVAQRWLSDWYWKEGRHFLGADWKKGEENRKRWQIAWRLALRIAEEVSTYTIV